MPTRKKTNSTQSQSLNTTHNLNHSISTITGVSRMSTTRNDADKVRIAVDQLACRRVAGEVEIASLRWGYDCMDEHCRSAHYAAQVNGCGGNECMVWSCQERQGGLRVGAC